MALGVGGLGENECHEFELSRFAFCKFERGSTYKSGTAAWKKKRLTKIKFRRARVSSCRYSVIMSRSSFGRRGLSRPKKR